MVPCCGFSGSSSRCKSLKGLSLRRMPLSWVESARVFAMSSSLPAVLLIDSVIARSRRDERQFAVGGPQINVCGSITASWQLPERAVAADCLSAHTVALHEGIKVGTRPAQIWFTGNGGFASENSKPSADHQSVVIGRGLAHGVLL